MTETDRLTAIPRRRVAVDYDLHAADASGDPWNSIGKVLRAEREIRLNRTVNVHDLGLDAYWTDLVCLLQIYGHYKRREGRKIDPLRKLSESCV